MDYYLLTELTARVAYHLALSGAETFRIEETMRRIIGAYGIECQAFAIPNCVMVSLEAANGKPLMVMKRVGFHGNDLESVEKLNVLSRRICAETPPPEVAAQWLKETLAGRRSYSTPIYYLGNFLAAAGFCPVFGGTLRDSLFAGLMGLIIGFVTRQMDKWETNPFFSTIAAAFAMAVPAYLAAGFHLIDYVDAVIIGSLMILVPGLLITNSMRDIIYGDTNSGINRIVQVLLSALAIAMGTAAAWQVTSGVYGVRGLGVASRVGAGRHDLHRLHGLFHPLQRARLGQLSLRRRRRGDVDGVSAAPGAGRRHLWHELFCFRGRGRLFGGHGALSQVSGHVVPRDLQHPAAAGGGHLLHDELRTGGQYAGRASKGT